MKNVIVLTDKMIDAAYNCPDKTPDAAKRLMRDVVERVLLAGGYQVVDRVDSIDPYVVQEADKADGEDETSPERRMLQMFIAHSPYQASQWNWPVKFSIESILPPTSTRRIRFVCEDEHNCRALYYAVADIIGVGAANEVLGSHPVGFIVTSTMFKLVTGTLLAAMPVECRPKDGEVKSFEFTQKDMK